MSAVVQLNPRESILPTVPRRRKNTEYRQREYLRIRLEFASGIENGVFCPGGQY